MTRRAVLFSSGALSVILGLLIIYDGYRSYRP